MRRGLCGMRKVSKGMQGLQDNTGQSFLVGIPAGGLLPGI